MEDIELAIETCRSVGNNDITLLKCTSSYPAPIEEANLCMINEFSERFHVKAGLSDHTLGSVAPVVATSLGAVMIEKHFIINREIGGPDSSFSMEESEFTQMVRDVRMAEAAVGKVSYELTEKQMSGRCFARSLYVAENMKAGDIITEKNVRSVRPGYGLHPMLFSEILGKRVKTDLRKGVPMQLKYIL